MDILQLSKISPDDFGLCSLQYKSYENLQNS